MTPLPDDEIATMLRAEVGALDGGAGSLDDVLGLGRRRVHARRTTAGLGALALAGVVAVTALQVSGPAEDRGLPAQEPTVTLTERPTSAPDPQPVYDALDARLAEMGLPAEHGGWSAGPVADGVGLSVTGPGFVLETVRVQDNGYGGRPPVLPADVAAGGCDAFRELAEGGQGVGEGPGPEFVPAPLDCEDLPVESGELWLLSYQGVPSQVTFRDEVSRVSVGATSWEVVPGAPLGREQLLELATDPDLRWR